MANAVLYHTGLWMIVATAGLFVVLTMIVVQTLPRLVWPLYIAAWLIGIAGFALVCIAQPTLFNIVLGLLFAAAAIVHGLRLKNRADSVRDEAGSESDE